MPLKSPRQLSFCPSLPLGCQPSLNTPLIPLIVGAASVDHEKTCAVQRVIDTNADKTRIGEDKNESGMSPRTVVTDH